MKTLLKSALHAVLLVAGLLFLPAGWAAQPNYKAMYVFGDSLSDNGNDFIASTDQHMVPAVPPSVTPYATYWNGRFTNGHVAVEYLWQRLSNDADADVWPYLEDKRLKNPAVSLAFGGSTSGLVTPTPTDGLTVPGALGQLALYTVGLRGKKAPSNALYVIWTGGNDYVQGVTTDPEVVVRNIALTIRGLYLLGARDFLVPNLPDLGLTPLARFQGLGPQMTQLSKAHNALLAQRIKFLELTMPKSNVMGVDVFGLGQKLVAANYIVDLPQVEALSPGTGAVDCLFRDPATCVDVPMIDVPQPFLFWDVLHPTTRVHQLIATEMYKALGGKP